MDSLKVRFERDIVPQLKKDLGLNNIYEVPRFEKVVLNMGVGEAAQDSKRIQSAEKELTAIAGQKAVVTKARKSIAGFKIREGMPLGVKVTLRKARMFEFLDRLIYIALPRVRDFRGFSLKSFNDAGNYSFGISEQIVFPEINYDRIDKVRGIDITFCTTTNKKEEARQLLTAINFPFMEA